MKTVVKRALKWLSISVCVVVLACVVLLVFLHTGPGKSMIGDFLSGVLSRGEGSVKITGLDFLLHKRLGFETLAVRDGKGPWLVVEDAFLKWDPWSVVKGRIHVLDAGARSVAISRVPESAFETSKGKSKASGDVPWELLSRVSIASASFESVSIHEAVAGAGMRFSLDASLSPAAPGGDACFFLDVERLDGPGGHARISASVNASSRNLTVDGRISDPEGGVVSTLMEKPVPVDVSISGAGPFSMWTGSMEGTAGELGALSLDLTLKKHGGAFNLVGNGEVVVFRGITGRPHPDSVTLAFDANLSKKRKIIVRDFRLKHNDGKFISTATFDPEAGTITGSFTLGVPDAGSFFPREAPRVKGDVAIAGELKGTVVRPVLDMEVTGTGVYTYDFTADRVTGKIHAVLEREDGGGNALDVQAEAAGSGLVFPGEAFFPGEDVCVEASMHVSADGAVSGQGNASLGTELRTSFSGSLSPDRSFSGDVDLKIAELAPFSSVSGTPLSGLANLNAHFEGNADSLRAEAEGDFSNVHAGGFHVHQGKIGLNARGRLSDMAGDVSVDLVSGEGDFHLNTGIRNNVKQIDLVGLVLRGPGSTVEGNIGFSHETKFVTGGLTYRFENPGQFLKTRLNGKGTGSIRFFDDGKEQKALVELTGSQVETEHGSIARIRAEGEAAGLFSAPRGTVSCVVTDLAAGDLRVSSTTIEGEFSDSGLLVGLDLKGSFHSDFSSGFSAAFFGGPERILAVSRLEHVHGGVPLKLNSPVRVIFTGGQVSVEEASFSIGKGTFRGSGVFDRDASVYSLEASCQRLPLALASVLGYESGEGWFTGHVSVSSRNETPVLNLDALVEGFRFPGSRRATFPALDADFRVKSDGKRFEGTGEIRGAGKTPLTVDVGFPLEDCPSSVLPRFMPAGEIEGRLAWNFDIKDVHQMGVRMPGGLSGKADLTIDIHGTSEKPEIKGAFHVADGGYRDLQRGSSIENIGLNVSAYTLSAGSSNRLALKGTLSGISSSPFEMSAELPFVFSLSPFRFTFPSDGELTGFLRGELDLAAVPAALSLDRHYIKGLMNLDVDLRGTVVNPRVSGSAQWNQGYFEDITTGTVIEDISLHIEASPPRLRIVHCQARAGQNGSVEVGGWLEAAPGETVSYDVTLKMEDAAVLRRDDAHAVMDGSLRLKGTGLEALMTGSMVLKRAEIMISDHVANDIPQLDVVEIHGDRTVQPPPPSEETSRSLPIDYDVKLKSPGRLFVAGRGLDSEWKGSIHVKGKSPDMDVSGGFSLVRGYFNLLGKRFTLSSGTIQLGGPSGTSPLVDVEGKASSGGMTADVKVSGPSASPSITLSSTPPYPSDEILARLLFGRSPDTLTPLQALQLAQAVRTLAGGGGLDVFGKTKKLLGIDQLELTQSDEEEGEAAIRAGKYVHDRVYFQVEQGMGSASSRASVEVELSPNLSLETEMGADSGGGVGLKWRWDY
jgi:autotransporter translocation and assembly factor TamB